LCFLIFPFLHENENNTFKKTKQPFLQEKIKELKKK